MFVSLEKLSRHPPVDSLTQPPPSGQHYTPQPKDRKTSSSTESSADPSKFIYKIGDRVVAFTKKGVPVHGVVRWVGIHSFMVEKKPKSFKFVGIETVCFSAVWFVFIYCVLWIQDVKVKSNEIESLPSKSHLFTVTKGKSAVFLQEDQVLLEANFIEVPPERSPVPDQHREDQVEVQLQQLQQHNHQLQQQLQQEQQRGRNLQERLDRLAGEMLNMCPATAVLMNVPFCTAKRSEVKTGAIIGEGAWGKVERGVFKGSTVAVKSIHTAILKQNTVERLRREINIMAQVRHPNLVRFIAAVLDGPAERLQAPPVIITELMDINLRQAYEEKRVVPAHYLTILRDVAYGLHHLHSLQQPIIHRDVSAPNVLLQQQPNGGWLAKVSDFGSANFAKQARTAGEGAIIYSAPETFPSTVSDTDSEPPLLTTKVDVFSYGVVACELVTGEMPASDKYRAMLRKVEKKWAFMHGLIVRCTKRNARERPSMADILDELPQPIPRPLK